MYVTNLASFSNPISGAAVEGVKANDMIFQQPQNPYVTVFEKLANGCDLDAGEALASFRALYAGTMPGACVGAFLMGLKVKGESAVELACAVRAALEEAVPVPEIEGPHIDVVGTGGDRMASFNCSTATALTLAAMGYRVTKHGNRSVSSVCGSADVLEATGFPLDLAPEEIARELERNNFVFLFAPRYHPAFKRIVPVRKEIGAHTIFNILGPLLNPTRPTHQLLGVLDTKRLPAIAEALAMGGLERGAVVHGFGGFDEVSPCGPTEVIWVRDGWTRRGRIDPGEAGFALHSPSDVTVRGLDDAVECFVNVLSGRGKPAMRDMLALNVAVALVLLEDGLDLPRAAARAREAVAGGAACEKFLVRA